MTTLHLDGEVLELQPSSSRPQLEVVNDIEQVFYEPLLHPEKVGQSPEYFVTSSRYYCDGKEITKSEFVGMWEVMKHKKELEDGS